MHAMPNIMPILVSQGEEELHRCVIFKLQWYTLVKSLSGSTKKINVFTVFTVLYAELIRTMVT